MNAKQLQSAIDEFDFNANDQTNITINMSGIKRLLRQKKTGMSQISNISNLTLVAGKEVSKIDQLDLAIRPSHRLQKKGAPMIRKTTGSSLKMTENDLGKNTGSSRSGQEGSREISYPEKGSSGRGRFVGEGYGQARSFGFVGGKDLKKKDVGLGGGRGRVRTIAYEDYKDFHENEKDFEMRRQTAPQMRYATKPISAFENVSPNLEIDDFMDYEEVKRVKSNLRKEEGSGEFNNFQKLEEVSEGSERSSNSEGMDSFDEEKEHKKFESKLEKKSIKDMILERKRKERNRLRVKALEKYKKKNSRSFGGRSVSSKRKRGVFEDQENKKRKEASFESKNGFYRKLNTDVSIQSGRLAPDVLRTNLLGEKEVFRNKVRRRKSNSRFDVDGSDFGSASFRGTGKDRKKIPGRLKKNTNHKSYPDDYIMKSGKSSSIKAKLLMNRNDNSRDRTPKHRNKAKVGVKSPNWTPGRNKKDPKLYSYISTSRGDFSPLTSQMRNQMAKKDSVDLVNSNLLTSQMRKKMNYGAHTKPNSFVPEKTPVLYKHNIYGGSQMDLEIQKYLKRSQNSNPISPKYSLQKDKLLTKKVELSPDMELKDLLKPYKVKTIESINLASFSNKNSRKNSKKEHIGAKADSEFVPKRGNTNNNFTPSQFLDDVNDLDKFDPFFEGGTTSIQESKTYLVNLKNQKVSVVKEKDDDSKYTSFFDKESRGKF